VAPEVAHEAAPGTLVVDQEEGGDADELPVVGRFVLHEETGGGPRVDRLTRAAAGEDPVCSGGGVLGVGTVREGWIGMATGAHPGQVCGREA